MSYLGYPPISPGFIDDTSLIVDGVIQTADIANSAITTAKIADDAVTSAKMDANITITGTMEALDFNTTSDITLKNNLQLVTNPLEKINQLSGYTFNWNHNDKPAVGVMAQEVEKVFPEMVTTGADGYKRVNYDALVPVLIEAIKELSSKIKA
jgi:hypothetical protein